MSKQMICSLATEDHIRENWHSWAWPRGEYLQEHHKKWLNTHCTQHWWGVHHTLYFQHDGDLHGWQAAYDQVLPLPHQVKLSKELRNHVPNIKLWCTHMWGPEQYSVEGWPQGTWRYGYVADQYTQTGASLYLQFAHAEQATQFALSFS